MGATLTHLAILAAVCLPGLAALVQDATTHTRGGLFSPYTFTKVLWIGIGTYALTSSLLIVMVAALRHHRGRPYAALGVLLTHAVPVGILALLLSLGVHDRIQDAWRSDEAQLRGAPTAPSGDRRRAPQGAPVAHRPRAAAQVNRLQPVDNDIPGGFPYYQSADRAFYVTRGLDGELDGRGITLDEWKAVVSDDPALTLGQVSPDRPRAGCDPARRLRIRVEGGGGPAGLRYPALAAIFSEASGARAEATVRPRDR